MDDWILYAVLGGFGALLIGKLLAALFPNSTVAICVEYVSDWGDGDGDCGGGDGGGGD